jgi:hypothetical protein
VRRLITRTAAWTLSFALTGAMSVVPCAASDHKPAAPARAASSAKLTQLSPASRDLLARATSAPQQQPPATTPSTPSSFFKSKRGAVTLALMGAGTGFALWSIQHDRKPVKSPVR